MFSYNGTPTNGIKIKTNIPFNSSSYAMPLVKIEGYSYGKAASLGLLINWYNYGYSNQFLNHGVCSFGSFAPPVTIAEENGLVVIFLGIGGDVYYQRFVVSVQESGYPQHQTSHFTGWTAVDEAISGSATNVNSLAYSADFGDGMTWKNDLFQVGPWSSQQKSLAASCVK